MSYTYDPYYARVATMVDGIGTTSYTYKAAGTNGAGQVATVDGPLSNDTIAYTYDELGRVIQRTINGSANQVDWTFDALGRVTSEENLLGEFTYSYHGVTNRLNTVTYPNGQSSTYTYLDDENDHRLETIHHKYPNASTLSKFDYTYDAVGNILTWRQQADTTAVLWRYGYDPADQLTSAVKHATDTPQTVLQRYAYAYDPAGNRTIEQIDDAVTLSAYDNLNRLTSQAPGGAMVIAGLLNEPGTVTINGVAATVDASNNFRGTVPTSSGTNTFTIVAKDASGNTTTQTYEIGVSGSGKTFTYDANGNLTSDSTRAFEWDARNQLLAVAKGASRREWSYGHLGNRGVDRKLEGGIVVVEQRLLFCGVRLCESRLDSGGVVSRIFGRGIVGDGDEHTVTHDHLGSVREVLEDSSLLSRFSYDGYGFATVEAGASSADGFAALGSHAQDVDVLQGAFRLYDPSLGRWISEDPINLQGGINLYRYGLNNPVNRIDPLGLSSCRTLMSYPASLARLVNTNRFEGHKRLTSDRSDVDEGPNFYGAPGVASFGLPINLIRCGWERDVKIDRLYERKWIDVKLCNDDCYGPYTFLEERNRRWRDIEEFTERGYFNLPAPFWVAAALAGEACRKWLPYVR